jgi:hypothetical protein
MYEVRIGKPQDRSPGAQKKLEMKKKRAIAQIGLITPQFVQMTCTNLAPQSRVLTSALSLAVDLLLFGTYTFQPLLLHLHITSPSSP